MHFLYTCGIVCYGWAIRAASLFNPKAKTWVQGRKNWKQLLPDTEGKKVIWFHCASLGEFDQGLPLMQRIRADRPEAFIVVTFFSPSGMQFYHTRSHPADVVLYMPLDTPSNARIFTRHFQAEMAFFVKYEFWSNHILACKEQGTRLFNISGVFRPEQRFFKWYGGYFRETLRNFEWFFVQNEQSSKLLQSIGITAQSISGDTRFDRVLENKQQRIPNPLLEQFCADSTTLVVGSSWPEDERMLAEWIANYSGKVLLAPHAIDEAHIKTILHLFPEAITYTECEKGAALPEKILVLNTMGQLANAYYYGKIAYVGGAFSGSLHNILEPAVYGLPVLFGPRHSRFPEADRFLKEGIGFSISNAQEFGKCFSEILGDLDKIAKKTETFVAANAGAADKMWKHISSN